ncbi:MAG: N-acetyltransferase [Thermodesulfobacteriota bacterium]|nr:N-acetyltransferase [Thermodesulfobacteriota bacterium]
MIRKAMIYDVKPIHALLQHYSSKGELLARPLSKLYDHLRDFWVYEEAGDILGCCALQFCWEDLAEIRSLAVWEKAAHKGIGTLLVDRCVQEALVFQIKSLFTLTYRPEFFKRFDFSVIDRSELPLKIWADCILCVNFPDCDEIAMIKPLYE